jgi:hypothetical protein
MVAEIVMDPAPKQDPNPRRAMYVAEQVRFGRLQDRYSANS